MKRYYTDVENVFDPLFIIYYTSHNIDSPDNIRMMIEEFKTGRWPEFVLSQVLADGPKSQWFSLRYVVIYDCASDTFSDLIHGRDIFTKSL